MLIERVLPDILKPLWLKRKLITLVVGSATLVAIIVSLLLPRWYQSSSVILSPQESASSLNALGALGSFGVGLLGQDTESQRYLAILKSRVLAERMVMQFDLRETYDQETLDETIEVFRDKFAYYLDEELQVVISMLDRDQERVADMVNFAVATLDSINIALSTNHAVHTRRFLGDRLESIIDTLTSMEHDAVEFMNQNQILDLPQQVVLEMQTATQLQAVIIEKEQALEIARVVGSGNSARIEQLEKELEILRQIYDSFLTGELVEQFSPPFALVPGLGVELLRQQRAIDYTARIMEYLGPEFEKARLEEARNVPTLQVLDRGVRPDKKARPRRRMIVMSAFFLSFLFTSFYAMVTDNKHV